MSDASRLERRASSLEVLSDDELLRRLAELVERSRACEADLVAHIGEVDTRRLYAREAAPSMFAYCTRVLHYSPVEARDRGAGCRAGAAAGRAFPDAEASPAPSGCGLPWAGTAP